MQRQLCIKLLSKIPRNASTANTNSIFQPNSSSSFLKSNANPFYQHSFSQHSTLSPSHLWKFCSSNGVSGSIRNGFFSSPVLARRSFSNLLSKGQSKFPVNGTVGTQAGRNFHSFDSQYRGWRSIFRRLTTDGVVIGLIVTNVAVFLLWRIASPQFMVKNFMIGRTFGPEYLLKLYLSGAVVGSIFYLAYHAFIAPSFQGASGAVNAIMLLDIFLFPSATLYFNFFIPIPAILLGIFMVGKDVLRILEGDHEVSGSAHLGGATVAALAWAQSRKGRFRRF
ncbi:UNVERIFIED_CONTAM: RHOMBOID-like protein 12, mitochondrial [Sesamum radiatum]|uniref:RHOMBOID-like protein 12, mitochondrial n=1 Tax=Sesamum radiatum TaxID=300843 RepID=A0AAW2MY84_SESRA